MSAHVTLFHHLPGEEIESIENDLKEVCADYKAFEVRFPKLRFLGRGTAAEIESAELLKLRSKLVSLWEARLNNQDRQKFKPHVTIQNKVAPDEARRLFENLQTSWQAKTGNAVGLELWHYENGPWRLADAFPFGKKV